MTAPISPAGRARAEALAVYGHIPPAAANRDRHVLGAEIDHLRGYGWNVDCIARRLGCSRSAVEKWIKGYPDVTETWEVAG